MNLDLENDNDDNVDKEEISKSSSDSSKLNFLVQRTTARRGRAKSAERSASA